MIEALKGCLMAWDDFGAARQDWHSIKPLTLVFKGGLCAHLLLCGCFTCLVPQLVATLAGWAVKVLCPQQELPGPCSDTLSAWMSTEALLWGGLTADKLCLPQPGIELNTQWMVTGGKRLKDSQTCHNLCLKVLPLEFYILHSRAVK